MAQNLKTGDTVKIIAGDHKGKSGEIVGIDRANRKAMIKDINVRTRHIKATQFNPKGGKKTIHQGIDWSNLVKTADAPAHVSKKKTAKKAPATDKKSKKAKKGDK